MPAAKNYNSVVQELIQDTFKYLLYFDGKNPDSKVSFESMQKLRAEDIVNEFKLNVDDVNALTHHVLGSAKKTIEDYDNAIKEIGDDVLYQYVDDNDPTKTRVRTFKINLRDYIKKIAKRFGVDEATVVRSIVKISNQYARDKLKTT